MFSKNYYTLILLMFLFVVTEAAFSQGASIKGTVMLEKSVGSSPVAGANVDCYNVTNFTQLTKSGCSSTKTNEKGEFVISGLDAKAKFILSVSGKGIGPRITLEVKPSGKNEKIIVDEGNGKALTKAEVWQAFADSKRPSGGFSDDQKQAKVQYDKWRAERESMNEEIKENNAQASQLLEEGNIAYADKNYDLAIAKYEEGYNVNPEFVGSAPVFLNNKAAALKNRAVDNFNAAIKNKDTIKINNARIKVGNKELSDAACLNSTDLCPARIELIKDLSDAIDAASKAYNLLDNASPADITDQANHKKNKFNATDYVRDTARIMVQTGLVDAGKVSVVKKLLAEYVKMQSDKVKKGKAQSVLASYIMGTGDYAAAAIEFKKAFRYLKKDPDVLAGLGLSLYTVSYETNDKAQQQESLNYMDFYLKTAPKKHRMRDGIEGAVDDLTKNHKLKPKKLK